MKIKRAIVLGVLVAGAGLAGVFLFQCADDRCIAFRRQIEDIYAPLRNPVACEKQIAYAIGTFDDRFGVSRETFLDAIKEAEAIWEVPIGRGLFMYAGDGKLKINLVYDYRQQATSKLKGLGIVVGEDQASYDALKVKYAALHATYAQAKADYDARVAAFTRDQDIYNQHVRSVNARGGASRNEYGSLQEEKTALQGAFAEIQKREVILHEYIDDINVVAMALNHLAAVLNLNVAAYNEIGTSRGEIFTEGDYQEYNGEQEITIYEFSSREKLVRVLAHELGHALGLSHVADPKAIMYKLNTSANEKLTGDDTAELKARCAIKG